MSWGSATGNPRNKVALKPGHSLMDWIRLGNSGKDLAGTGGAYLSVTKAQLAQHNKQDDAWLCIRGKVYNVTSYMDFHPGGPEELMKGVGTDATKVFNEVHAWVNYESILQKCVVGHLHTACDEDIDITSSLSPPSTPSKPKSSNQQNGTLQNKPPQMDWFQQVDSICLIIYTKTPVPSVHVSLEGEDMLLTRVNSATRLLKLEAGVSWPASVLVDLAGKVQIRLRKLKPGLWSRYGTLQHSPDTVSEYWDAKIVDRLQLTHDTHQVDISYCGRVFNYLPVAHHLLVRATVDGVEVERPYTPVGSLAGLSVPPTGCVRLIVKRYPGGVLSSWLTTQPLLTQLQLSTPKGDFSTQHLASASHLVLIAAGSGLTPMLSLLSWALRHSRSKICLVFFNKTEKDIICEEQLAKLTTENSRLSVDHVLSEPSSEWRGKTGHISLDLLQSYLPTASTDIPNTYYACVCGPPSFTQLTKRFLSEDLGFTSNNFYCFLGL